MSEGYICVDAATIDYFIGDDWFDLDECQHDQRNREFRLGFGSNSKGPYDERLLVVTDVLDVSVEDKAEIGIYDLHEVKFEGGSVQIICNIPLQITLRVGPNSELSILNHPDRAVRGA